MLIETYQETKKWNFRSCDGVPVHQWYTKSTETILFLSFDYTKNIYKSAVEVNELIRSFQVVFS